MKKFRFTSLLVVFVMLFAVFGQAMPARAESSGTIADIVASNPQFKTLAAAVTAAGLLPVLQSEGPFTVFAPTDAAFAMLPKGTVEALLNDIPALTNILLYHVAAANLPASEVVNRSAIQTVQGSKAVITLKADKVFINNARIITTDIQASNGTIHVINRVILPPTKTIMEIVREESRLSTLEAAIDAAGLASVLEGPGPFTLLAPTDKAFSRLPAGTIPALLADIPALTNVLTYHVFSGDFYSGDVKKTSAASTVQGSPVAFTPYGNSVFINDGTTIILRTDLLATNGVVHIISAVLLPPTKDIVDTLASDPRFKTLVAAVGAAGLVDTLKSEGPLTVYAPTDKAFKKLPAGTIPALLNDIPTLTSILTYHVSPGAIYMADILKASTLPTVNGAEIDVTVQPMKVYLDNARVREANIITTNGVIHVIDTVLLP